MPGATARVAGESQVSIDSNLALRIDDQPYEQVIAARTFMDGIGKKLVGCFGGHCETGKSPKVVEFDPFDPKWYSPPRVELLPADSSTTRTALNRRTLGEEPRILFHLVLRGE